MQAAKNARRLSRMWDLSWESRDSHNSQGQAIAKLALVTILKRKWIELRTRVQISLNLAPMIRKFAGRIQQDTMMAHNNLNGASDLTCMPAGSNSCDEICEIEQHIRHPDIGHRT